MTKSVKLRLPLLAGFALLAIGALTDNIAWSYAGLAVFAIGATAMFAMAAVRISRRHRTSR